MQGRSWMAALTLAVGALSAQDPKARADGEPGVHKVKLDLRIAGLGRAGCEVEVKPAHEGCQFQPLKKHVGPNGTLMLELKDVQTSSADRDCAFAITIREPGHALKTVHRGLRLAAQVNGRPMSPQTLTCFITSPSLLVGNQDDTRVRR